MTRLKIEVVGKNDYDVRLALDALVELMSYDARLDDEGYAAKCEHGNATAEVERVGAEEEEKRDAARYEYVEQEHMITYPSPKAGWELWRRHDASTGLPCKYIWRRLKAHEARYVALEAMLRDDALEDEVYTVAEYRARMLAKIGERKDAQ